MRGGRDVVGRFERGGAVVSVSNHGVAWGGAGMGIGADGAGGRVKDMITKYEYKAKTTGSVVR